MKRKMRILMCSSDIASVKGGMVSVIKSWLEYTGWKDAEIRYIPTHRDGSKSGKALFFARVVVHIIALLMTKRVDLVHLHMSERGSFYRKALLVRFSNLFRVPVILHHHGAEFEGFYEKLRGSQRDYVRKILEAADCNLVLSEAHRKLMSCKAPAARMEILHNAVKLEKERKYNSAGTGILSLGCLGKRKGTFDLLEAVAGIDSLLPEEIRLWLCGDGEIDEVKRKAEELGVLHRVAYLGWISGKDRERCMSEALMHVLPSYNEVLPMSILETMAWGIPNISTRIASIPEAIEDGVTGFLIEPGDVKTLQEKILLFVENADLRERMSKMSYKKIREEFSLQECLGRLETIYKGLIEA